MRKIKLICLAPLLLLPSAVLAAMPSIDDQTTYSSNFEVSAAVGANWLQAKNGTLVITSDETDKLVVGHTAPNDAWKIGVGYHLFKQELQQRQFFNDLLLEFNVYRSAQTINGDVWQYQDAQFNNYIFHAPVTSMRFMLDAKPTLFDWHNTAFYPILGVGVALDRLSNYNDYANPGVEPDKPVSLGGKTTKQLSYDLGAGIRAHLTPMVEVSLEYLYSDLGHASPSNIAGSELQPLSVSTFKLSNQAVFLGLNWNI